MKVLFPVVSLFLLAPGLAPGLASADASFECNEGASSQVEIADCMAETEARVDAAVETALSFASASATDLDEVTEREVALPALEAAQAAWVAYRDAQCEFVGATFGGGSGTGIAIRGCRIELGRARVTELLANVQ
jgi:uncharacterized protein YecT (DUF1311 family)